MSEIRYVGVSDRYISLFERQYPVEHGITYNSYVIFGERPVVVDSVDAAFALQWLTNVEKALEGRCPAALVCQHLEPDHSGSLRALLDRYPGMSLIVSSRAASMLPNFLDAEAYAGRLNKPFEVHGEENDLCWLPLTENFFDLNRFAGIGNVGHIILEILGDRTLNIANIKE